MFVKDLFSKYDVECPEWLSNERLEDDWDGSGYVLKDNMHKWTLITRLHNILITFNNEEYSLKVFSRNGELLFIKNITEETVMMS